MLFLLLDKIVKKAGVILMEVWIVTTSSSGHNSHNVATVQLHPNQFF